MKRTGMLLSSLLLAGAMSGAVGIQVAGAISSPHAKVTIGTKAYKISGGYCLNTSTRVDVGMAAPPNSMTINGKLHHGKFKNAQIGLTLGKSIDSVLTDTGSANAKGGSFKGTDISGLKVKGTFTC